MHLCGLLHSSCGLVPLYFLASGSSLAARPAGEKRQPSALKSQTYLISSFPIRNLGVPQGWSIICLRWEVGVYKFHFALLTIQNSAIHLEQGRQDKC